MQTRTYRFVGSNCSLGNGVQLERYGQKVELSGDEAFDYIVNANAALLPDQDFAKAGHTDAELEKYPTIQLQREAPADFIAKRKAVWDALHASREALGHMTGGPQIAEPEASIYHADGYEPDRASKESE